MFSVPKIQSSLLQNINIKLSVFILCKALDFHEHAGNLYNIHKKKNTHESTDLSSNFLVNSVTNQNIQNKAGFFFLFGRRRGGGHKIIILLHKYNFL